MLWTAQADLGHCSGFSTACLCALLSQHGGWGGFSIASLREYCCTSVVVSLFPSCVAIVVLRLVPCYSGLPTASANAAHFGKFSSPPPFASLKGARVSASSPHHHPLRSGAMNKFFYFEECPRIEKCSAAAWKRASVWSWSERECRYILANHLNRSSCHGMSRMDAEDLAAACAISEADTDHDPPPSGDRGILVSDAPADEERTRSRSRERSKSERGASPVGCGGERRGRGDSRGASRRERGGGGGGGSSSSAVALRSTRRQGIGGGASLSFPTGSTDGVVLVPRQQLSAAIDALTRASRASKQAHRLATAVATSYADEGAVFDEVRAHLQALRDFST